jgi:hypothetical protein
MPSGKQYRTRGIEAAKDLLLQEAYLQKINNELLSDLQQNWTHINGGVVDQYGMKILTDNGFKLIYKGEYVLTLYSLPAAKLISTIILNDIIANLNVVKLQGAKLEPVYINPNPFTGEILKRK